MKASRSARSSSTESSTTSTNTKHTRRNDPMTVHIHPSVDNGVKQGSGSFSGGTLVCKCKDRPVKVGIKGDVAHNHACGCTKCWKPVGGTLSLVAVAPPVATVVIEHGQRLVPVDGVAVTPES